MTVKEALKNSLKATPGLVFSAQAEIDQMRMQAQEILETADAEIINDSICFLRAVCQLPTCNSDLSAVLYACLTGLCDTMASIAIKDKNATL